MTEPGKVGKLDTPTGPPRGKATRYLQESDENMDWNQSFSHLSTNSKPLQSASQPTEPPYIFSNHTDTSNTPAEVWSTSTDCS